ncbi:hypothetical protein TCON_2357 [Astathelohania contejeani]|uniref:FPL domain-containing protein n=1 Tax=Astathelohania contejeani TaxID=164912 RepID=A0ABQ7HW83_9MICR|nr:hypothetical protein TCON_2357 [Thelohania contejeani]
MLIFQVSIYIIRLISTKNSITKTDDIVTLNNKIQNYDDNIDFLLNEIIQKSFLQKITNSYFHPIEYSYPIGFDHMYHIQARKFTDNDSLWIKTLYKLISLDKSFFSKNKDNIIYYFGYDFFILTMSTDIEFLKEFNNILINIVSNMIYTENIININFYQFSPISNHKVYDIITNQLVQNISNVTQEERNKITLFKENSLKIPIKKILMYFKTMASVSKYIINDKHKLTKEFFLSRYTLHPIDTNVEIVSDIFFSWYYIFSVLTNDSALKMHDRVNKEKFTKYIIMLFNRINDTETTNANMYVVYFALILHDMRSISKLFNCDHLNMIKNKDTILYNILLKNTSDLSDCKYQIVEFLFNEVTENNAFYKISEIITIIIYYNNNNNDMRIQFLKFINKTEREFFEYFTKKVFENSNWLVADQFKILNIIKDCDLIISIIFLNSIYNICKYNLILKNLSNNIETINTFSWVIKIMFSNWGYMLKSPIINFNEFIIKHNKIDIQYTEWDVILTELDVEKDIIAKGNNVSVEGIYKHMFSQLFIKNMARLIESITSIQKYDMTENMKYLKFYINLFLLNCSKDEQLIDLSKITNSEWLKTYLNSENNLFSELNDTIYEKLKQTSN